MEKTEATSTGHVQQFQLSHLHCIGIMLGVGILDNTTQYITFSTGSLKGRLVRGNTGLQRKY